MPKHHYTYLALGDSYTIGESVPLHESFPYQTIQLLRKQGYHFHSPEIIAKTGWTSFELAEHLLHSRLNDQYDFVTLLIGVNNQYRELPVEDFKTDFEFLLHKAIHVSGNHPERVIVLSIPDWGETPFAKEKNRKKIAKEINVFNGVCETVANKNKTHFINITDDLRYASNDKSMLATDQLHYSGKAHGIWAEKVVELISAHF